MAFGDPGEDLWPIAGRFTPDAPPGDSVGLYDPRRGVFYLKTTLESGPADLSFGFGPAGGDLLPVAADFTGQGHDTVGLDSHSEAARELYLSELLFDFVELVFDEPAVAIQSLYFDRGSEQGLHGDPMFVRADPQSHLLAAWIALEDITEDSGPLVYVPGSHRLPYAQSLSGEIEVLLDEQAQGYFDLVFHELASMADEYGLRPRSLVCRQGDVLIWHGSLFHGGAPVLSPQATRKSFVVHYATRAHYPERVSSYEAREGSFLLRRRCRQRLAKTKRLIGEGRVRGIDNPMRDVRV